MTIFKSGKTRDILIIIAIIAITLLALIALKNTTIDDSIKAFMPQGEKVNIINDFIEDEFGSIDPILVSMEVNDKTIISEEYLIVLKEITSRLEALPPY